MITCVHDKLYDIIYQTASINSPICSTFVLYPLQRINNVLAKSQFVLIILINNNNKIVLIQNQTSHAV